MYFFRDSNGNEVDLVLNKGGKLLPIEIKSCETFNSSFLKGLNYFHKIAKDLALGGFLIYAGDRNFAIQQHMVFNYKEVANYL